MYVGNTVKPNNSLILLVTRRKILRDEKQFVTSNHRKSLQKRNETNKIRLGGGFRKKKIAVCWLQTVFSMHSGLRVNTSSVDFLFNSGGGGGGGREGV